jgi:hypothetical protein
MRPDRPHESDDALSRALGRLPVPSAPRTLLPRVMAAARAMERPAPRAAAAPTWFMWPRTWQAASVVALAALVAGGVWLWPAAQTIVGASSSTVVSTLWMRVVDVAQAASDAASVSSIVWQAFFQPIVRYVLVWIVIMSAACATFGAALGRVALGGASHS